MTNERKAVQFHDRLVEALREELELACSGGSTRADGSCSNCGSQSCAAHYDLLAEIAASNEGKPR